MCARRFPRQVKRWLEVPNNIVQLLPFGHVIVVVDVKSSLYVLDIESGEQLLQLDSPALFDFSAITHPATYLNKVLLGSKQGTMRLVNVKTGKLIHEFEKSFGSEIAVLEQSPAIDVIAVGLKNGRILLHNIKYDETIQQYKQDGAVTSISF
ncbi:unnamed protein product, partial [Gongylonema pulchrum]|uniref:CNH domain-containing protein n=1 Tax=Gongylonema pulchrum TaxID=637853 RepID=A0A183E995_9BILA